MLFHGGSVFGKIINNPSKLAKSVLGIMVVCLYGGPKSLVKMLPVANLNAEFVQHEINQTKESIIVNQRYFKMCVTVPNKPWLTENGLFLLFDFVHLVKSFRNNLLTEKNKRNCIL